MDNDGVTPVSEDSRSWDAAIDGHCRAGDAIGSHSDVGKLEVVLSSYPGVGGL